MFEGSLMQRAVLKEGVSLGLRPGSASPRCGRVSCQEVKGRAWESGMSAPVLPSGRSDLVTCHTADVVIWHSCLLSIKMVEISISHEQDTEF